MSDYAENAIDALIAHHPSPGEQFYPAFEATPELDAAASEYITHYPEGKQQSAVLPFCMRFKRNSATSARTPSPGRRKSWDSPCPRAGRGHFLSRPAPDLPRQEPHPRLPHAFLRHGGGGQPLQHHLHAPGNRQEQHRPPPPHRRQPPRACGVWRAWNASPTADSAPT